MGWEEVLAGCFGLVGEKGFSELSDNIGQLKMPCADGKMRGTEADRGVEGEE